MTKLAPSAASVGLRCPLLCKTPMSNKLGGSCGDACALPASHEGRCKCRLMLKIDAAVTPLYASEKDLDGEMKEQRRVAKALQRSGEREQRKSERKKAANG